MFEVEYASFCIYCRSGSEDKIAATINKHSSGIIAIAPKRIIKERRKSAWIEREFILLPCYVFLYAKDEFEVAKVIKDHNIYKILKYDMEARQLMGEDLEYANWVYRSNGKISPSVILEDGDEIRVIEGPLVNCNGKIVWMDKHKRRVKVEFNFDGVKRQVSLSAQVLSQMELKEKQSN